MPKYHLFELQIILLISITIHYPPGKHKTDDIHVSSFVFMKNKSQSIRKNSSQDCYYTKRAVCLHLKIIFKSQDQKILFLIDFKNRPWEKVVYSACISFLTRQVFKKKEISIIKSVVRLKIIITKEYWDLAGQNNRTSNLDTYMKY